MRRTLALAALLLAVPAVARANPRGLALSVQGGGGLFGDVHAQNPAGLASVIGASIAYLKAPPELPEETGAVAQAAVVPELTLERFGDRSAALAGARFELDIAQRRMGLMQVSARCAMWLAPRIGWMQDASSVVGGGDFGFEWFTRSGWGIGYWMGAMRWNDTMPTPAHQIAITAGLIVTRAP